MHTEKNTTDIYHCPMVKFVNLISGKWS
ncbi:hypothetical protein SASC598J21_002630, partial [Snodgrassella alvi SCGC AB-598-J21]